MMKQIKFGILTIFLITAMIACKKEKDAVQKVFVAKSASASASISPCHLRLMADVNGDSLADIVGFGNTEVFVSLGQRTGRFAAPVSAIANFTYGSGGWTTSIHLRQLADVNGDGRADIVGFGNDRVYVALGQFDGRFSPVIDAVTNFTAAQGWSQEQHIRTLADVNGDGKADIVGFGSNRVLVALGQASGRFAAPVAASTNFTAALGWSVNNHPRYLADVNGDRKADVIGFGGDRISVAFGQADGKFSGALASVNDFCLAQGWTAINNPRYMADVNGDGKPDIVGFGRSNVLVALGRTDGYFFSAPVAASSNFTIDGGGWTTTSHIRQLADVNGDRKADVVGFGNDRVYVALGRADGIFSPVVEANNNFTAAQGWSLANNLRYLADVNGDRKADIVGFGDSSVFVATGQTSGTFAPAVSVLNAFTPRTDGWITCPQ